MKKHTHPTPPRFRPVPAVPIVVLSSRRGECCVIVGYGYAIGHTLRAAIDAAVKILGDE